MTSIPAYISEEAPVYTEGLHSPAVTPDAMHSSNESVASGKQPPNIYQHLTVRLT